MNLFPKNKVELREIKKFIVIFYIIGFIGFIIPFTPKIFRYITPLALLISVYLLALYHTDYNRKSIFVFSIIYLSGFFIEVLGVKSGLIFGPYKYGYSLGPGIFGTPLIIGINWLFLVYTCTSIIERFKLNTFLKVVLASCLMVVYDLVLEQVAGKMDMWYWEGSHVPIKNYIAWYIISFIFISLFQVMKMKTTNKLSLVLFVCQFTFLFALMIFL